MILDLFRKPFEHFRHTYFHRRSLDSVQGQVQQVHQLPDLSQQLGRLHQFKMETKRHQIVEVIHQVFEPCLEVFPLLVTGHSFLYLA